MAKYTVRINISAYADVEFESNGVFSLKELIRSMSDEELLQMAKENNIRMEVESTQYFNSDGNYA